MVRTAPRVRRALWALLLAIPMALAGLVDNAGPAKSLWLCGHARANLILTSTSVSVLRHCIDEWDPDCEPGGPYGGTPLLWFGEVFVCVDH